MAEQNPGFHYKRGRLLTFSGWKSNSVQPESLAAAGFVYEGNDDQVRCVFCQLKLENWQPADDPKAEHKNMSANCRFVVDPDNCEGDETVVCDYIIDTVNDAVMFQNATYAGMLLL